MLQFFLKEGNGRQLYAIEIVHEELAWIKAQGCNHRMFQETSDGQRLMEHRKEGVSGR
jgi:hypothetical protein